MLMAKLSESSEFTIPLKNLLALIAGTAVAVWAYFGIIERLSFLEHNQEMLTIEVEENDTWIGAWKPPGFSTTKYSTSKRNANPN